MNLTYDHVSKQSQTFAQIRQSGASGDRLGEETGFVSLKQLSGLSATKIAAAMAKSVTGTFTRVIELGRNRGRTSIPD
jgi:hypothetical protein